jgi:flagellin
MTSLITNSSAMVALKTLTSINKNLASVQDQISTGKRINTAKDGSAVFAVSTQMRGDVTGLRTINDSLATAGQTVAVARMSAETITDRLDDMKALIARAQSGTEDRVTLQTEIDKLKGTIGEIVNAAQFNGVNLIKGSGTYSALSSLNRDSTGTVTPSTIDIAYVSLEATAGAAVAGALSSTTYTTATDTVSETIADTASAQINFDAGITAGNVFSVTIAGNSAQYEVQTGDTDDDVAFGLKSALEAAGVSGVSVDATANDGTNAAFLTITNNTGGAVNASAKATAGASGGLSGLAALDVSTALGATTAMSTIQTLLDTSIAAAASFGAYQARIDTQNDFISKLADSMEEGIGSLVDANMEEASAKLQALQVQQQLAIQSLSMANQAPQNVLSLFR